VNEANKLDNIREEMEHADESMKAADSRDEHG
jgi:hypothetical protein